MRKVKKSSLAVIIVVLKDDGKDWFKTRIDKMLKKLAKFLGFSKNPTEEIRQAAIAGDVPALKRLATDHGEKAIRLEENLTELTTLHLAAASGSVEAFEFLLQLQADPKAARINNFTPLHSAAMNGHTAICKLLLEAGAEIDAQTDPQGYAPLHSAAYAGHTDTIQLLLEYGANCELTNYRDERPVDTAKRTGQTEAIQLLEGQTN